MMSSFGVWNELETISVTHYSIHPNLNYHHHHNNDDCRRRRRPPSLGGISEFIFFSLNLNLLTMSHVTTTTDDDLDASPLPHHLHAPTSPPHLPSPPKWRRQGARDAFASRAPKFFPLFYFITLLMIIFNRQSYRLCVQNGNVNHDDRAEMRMRLGHIFTLLLNR